MSAFAPESPEVIHMEIPAPRPSSPTDNMLSPCTKKLWSKKKNIVRPKTMNVHHTFTLAAQVHAQPCPCQNMKLILGTSSSGRKTVVDALGWEYEQMSADIDGTA